MVERLADKLPCCVVSFSLWCHRLPGTDQASTHGYCKRRRTEPGAEALYVRATTK